MLVVGSHERLDARAPLGEAEGGREPILELEGEQVLMRAGGEVHRVPHSPEEIERLLELEHVPLADHAERHQLAEAPHLEAHLRHPERSVEVPKAPLPFLQLGLEKIDGIPRPSVPLAVLGELLLEERGRVLGPYLLEHAGLELAVEGLVAGEVARVEDGGLDLHVARRETCRLPDVAEGVSDRQAGIPQGVEDHLPDRLDVGVHLPGIEEEEVDVRAGVQLAAPVPALGDHRALLVQPRGAREEVGAGLGKEEGDEVIDCLGVGGDQREPAHARLVALAHARPRPRHVLAGHDADTRDVALHQGQRPDARQRGELGRASEDHPPTISGHPLTLQRTTMCVPAAHPRGSGRCRRRDLPRWPPGRPRPRAVVPRWDG